MIVHSTGFIGYPSYRNLNFSGSDTEEAFNTNLKKMPNDWYYRENNINYVYNSLGHRCKDITEINLSNYILFTGCSHTEGTGLRLEHTYAYRLAEILGCDYYNLGLGGTGIDVVTHNLAMWFKKVAARPKALVILWPDSTRFITVDDQQSIQTHIISDKNEKTTNFIISGDDVGFFESRKILSKTLISNLYENCAIIEACTSNNPEDGLPMLQHQDLARDLRHCGIISHDALAVELSKLIR